MARYRSLEFPLLKVEEVEQLILERVASGRSFELVRIGDGEGHLLGLDESYEQDELDYFADHFGEVDISFLRKMQRNLRSAIEAADVLGIRDDMIGVDFGGAPFSPELLRSHMPLRKSEQRIRPRSARRLYNTVSALSRLEYPSGQRYCSQWIHFRLQMTGFFDRLLASQPKVVVISSKVQVIRLLESMFDVEVGLLRVPDKFKRVSDSQAYSTEQFLRVNEQIKHVAPGRLFLIGAGLWGKVLAHTVKRYGGCALDIGALIDCWVGEATRPLVMEDLIGESFVRGHVPPEMRLRGRPGGIEHKQSL